MALTDAKYWLSARAGQSTPTDDIAAATLSGAGTATLVDRGSGNWAWQFSGGQFTVAIPSFLLDASTQGPGMVIAVTVRITNFGTLDDQIMIAAGNGAMAANKALYYPGLALSKYNSTAYVKGASEAATTGSFNAGTTVDHTFVLRFTSNAAGTYVDNIDMWVGTTGRVGTAPDLSTTDACSNFTVNTLSIAATNGAVLQVVDAAILPTLKTNTECSSLADNLRGTMPAPGSTAPGATLTGTSTITAGAATGGAAGTAPGATLTGVSTIAPGAASALNTGTLTTGVLKNNAGTPLASETGVTVNVYHLTTGALIVQKTGATTNSSGIAAVVDALIVPGVTYGYEVVLTGSRRRLPTKAAT
jgi:hypothetical protein